MIISLDNFIGQEMIKRNIEIFIKPKIKAGKRIPHILFSGRSGTGKTTLAKIIGGDNIKVIMAPMIKTKADILSVLTSLNENQVLFIDEIHRLDKEIEEILYQVIDSGKISIVVGKEGSSNLIEFETPNISIMGATTLSGLISKPFKDRFEIIFNMVDYNQEDIENIVKIYSKEVRLCDKSISKIAKNAKKTPRIAKNISNRCIDYANYLDKNKLDLSDVSEVLKIIGVKDGLTSSDFKYLNIINDCGGIAGLDLISKQMLLEKVNIITDIEPYLISAKYIQMSPKGRKITKKGLEII